MKLRTWIIIIGGTFLAIVVAASLYRTVTFHLSATSPSNNDTTVPPQNDVTFTFNRDLDATTANETSVDPSAPVSISTNGKTLTIHPTAAFAANTQYTVTVQNPTDSSGNHIAATKLTFTTGYTDFNALPKSQQQAQQNSTDKIEQQNPIIQHLPYDAPDYSISFSTDKTGAIHYLITLNVVPLYSGDPTYIPALKKAQSEALSWLQSEDADPTTMSITYNPDPNTGTYNANQ